VDARLLELAEEPGLWLPPEPSRAVYEGDGYTLVTQGRSAWVHHLRLSPDRVEPALAEVRAKLAELGLEEASWWVGGLSQPPDLAGRLAAFGLEPDDPPALTSLTLGEPPAGEATVPVRRVETLGDQLAALELDWEAWSVPEDERARRRVEAEAAWPSIEAHGRQATFVAFLDDEPVGFGRAVFTEWAGILLGGATLPPARGRGVYTSLVHARWDEAVRRGIPRLTVSGGPMSAPILERLGFRPIGTVRLLRDRVSLASRP
jgi:GNAT superfamily N-acetyltransferase